MRTLALVALSLPAVATAYDGETEEVRFEARTQLFRGEDVTEFWPSADSMLAVKFSADTMTEIGVDMVAESDLSWPEAMKHEWRGVAGGGVAELVTSTTLEASVRVNAFGSVVDVPVMTMPFEWPAQGWFDSVLLPGATESVSLSLVDAHFFQFDVEIPIADGWMLTFGLDGNPTADAVVVGRSLTTNDVTVTDLDGHSQLEVPAVNHGVYLVDALWTGHVDATWGVELIPWVRVAADDLGEIELPLYVFDWELGADSRDIASKGVAFEHGIPAIDVVATIDLGTVEVGQTAEKNLTIDNDGELRLTGRATYAGDAGFRVLEPSFAADVDDDDHVVVRFSPTTAGAFEGVITLTSNDPIEPTLRVAVTGEALALDDETDEEGGYGRIRGCGCATGATPMVAPTIVSALTLVSLAGLRRRSR